MALIFGQAATLVDSLITWKIELPPLPTEQREGEEHPIVVSIHTLCTDSVATLENQAQTLIKTVLD